VGIKDGVIACNAKLVVVLPSYESSNEQMLKTSSNQSSLKKKKDF
jgi:hypothetical protein